MPDGYHAFFSDGFKYTAGASVDMRGFDGVAFLLADGTTPATVQMADDAAFTVNLVTPVIEVDHGTPIQMPGGATPPFWLEAWRPSKRYVRVNGATGTVTAFQFRHTGSMPIGTAGISTETKPNRAGGRVT